MFKKSLILLILSLVSLILISCIFEADNGNFSFELTVVDGSGNPVEGLNIALVNNIANSFEGREENYLRAQTSIRANLGISAHCEIIIKNIKNNPVRTLVSEEMNSGSYTINWNGKDDEENNLPSGLYYCQMKAQNEGETFYQESHAMYLQSFHNTNGSTDADGFFQTNNKKPFINLFKTDSLQIVDQNGYELGREAFSDTTIICLSQGDSSQVIQMEYVKIKNKKNKLELIWDPENRAKEISVQTEIIQHKPVLEKLRGSDDNIIPSDDAELIGSYPNPFN